MDVLANPEEEVLVYDTESWATWKQVWDTFERDGVPRTEDLNIMQRCVLVAEHCCCKGCIYTGTG